MIRYNPTTHLVSFGTSKIANPAIIASAADIVKDTIFYLLFSLFFEPYSMILDVIRMKAVPINVKINATKKAEKWGITWEKLPKNLFASPNK